MGSPTCLAMLGKDKKKVAAYHHEKIQLELTGWVNRAGREKKEKSIGRFR